MKHSDSSPLVSVIIPNYNNSRYLRDCVESVLRQSLQRIEVVIVDDASTDYSLLVIDDLELIDSRISSIRLRENGGPSRARHIGISRSKADYVCTLDADDIYLSPRKLAAEFDVIRDHGDRPVMAYSVAAILDADAKFQRIRSTYNDLPSGMIFNWILARRGEIPRDFVMPKHAYFAVGGYDFSLKVYEDWDLKLRLARRFPFFPTQEVGTGYRKTGTGLSSSNMKVLRRHHTIVFWRNLSHLRGFDRLEVLYSHYKIVLRFELMQLRTSFGPNRTIDRLIQMGRRFLTKVV